MTFRFSLRPSLSTAALGAAISCLGAVSAEPALSAEVHFNAPGASVELSDRLQAASTSLGVAQSNNVQEILAAALSDYRTLVQVLYDAGHFAPIVHVRLDGREAALIQPLYLPRQVQAVAITVKPGPRFRFSHASIGPLPAHPEASIPKGFARGEDANTGILKEAADAGTQAWRQAGHAKAQIAGQEIAANHRSATLRARLHLNPGPKLRFGYLQAVGDSDVSPQAIQRIAGFPTGEVFHPDLAAKTATRLRRTGTFASVTLKEAPTPNPDGSLDFTARLEDMPKRRLTFGAELSSTDGLEVSASWMHRNLFGNAEKFRFETRLSGIGSSNDLDGRIALRLDQPATLGPDDNLFYLLEAERLDEEHYSTFQALGGIGVRRVFSDHLFAEAGIGATSILATDAFGKRRFKYAAGFLRVEYDRRNSSVDASRGYFLDARARPFFGLDGRDPGLQLKLDGRIYHGLGGSDRIVLAGRAQLGSVIGPSLGDTAPTLLFFSGGAGSVRGHEFQSLGIPVGTNASGGRGYLALSGEIRAKIGEKFSLVGFADIGYLDSDSFITSSSQSHAGAGIGLRYDVAGIGPLRVDFAYPVKGDKTDGLQFYIGVGQAF
ncbi:outer membrane protein, OMP85 family [Roseobacter sp. SK209-2-6]|uniref:autotransporter assembly complex protein TamA n=1 Tax=Roseobacter sp. SK209-2-6 TaxID=388739 RepID=UPI0000F3CE61|nr:BamA/TamA family outer membrane protein [Roseobacter sp. SK209-2-6]EBA15959.1 outer membrane protein, OMP85 family [Roseobacter sp. SK209-2-6]